MVRATQPQRGPEPVARGQPRPPARTQSMSAPADDEGRRELPRARDPGAVQPVPQLLLPVGRLEGVRQRRRRLELATQRVELAELGRGHAAGRHLAQRVEQAVAGALELGGRARGRGGRVVDLVGQPGRERPERDERRCAGGPSPRSSGPCRRGRRRGARRRGTTRWPARGGARPGRAAAGPARRRGPSRGRRRARPRPGSRRPSDPARPSGRRRRPHGRCGATRSSAPSTTTHQ